MKFLLILLQNVPTHLQFLELRPIETFWFHLKAKVHSVGFKAHYTDDLIKRIKNQIKNLGHHILRTS